MPPRRCSCAPGPPSGAPTNPGRAAMPDPFEGLRSPAPPADPDPAFAARLRARVARALALPKGVTVSNLDLETLETLGTLEAEPEPAAHAPSGVDRKSKRLNSSH